MKKKVCAYILELLKQKIPNIEMIENDFAIKENNIIYKLGSCSSRDFGDKYIYTAVHLSINVDLDLIKGICTKEMIKIPRALSEFGVSADDIKDKIVEYFK